jgi:hypothetical protein
MNAPASAADVKNQDCRKSYRFASQNKICLDCLKSENPNAPAFPLNEPSEFSAPPLPAERRNFGGSVTPTRALDVVSGIVFDWSEFDSLGASTMKHSLLLRRIGLLAMAGGCLQSG